MPIFRTLSCLNVPDVEFVSLTQELRRFRQRLETEAEGTPLHLLEVNAADLLSDLCLHLGLGQKQHDEILGVNNVRYLEAVRTQPVSLTVKH